LLHYKSVARKNDLVILRIRRRDTAPTAICIDRRPADQAFFKAALASLPAKAHPWQCLTDRFAVFSAPKSSQPAPFLSFERNGAGWEPVAGKS
jgi:hypothetical protein